MAELHDDRLADFLDDKLQTPADLATGNLDALLARIADQQALLKTQVTAAQQDLEDAKHAAHAHHTDIQQEAQNFRRAQADIDRRLLVITASETSDEVVPRFEAILDNLDRLDVANGYVVLLARVDALR